MGLAHQSISKSALALLVAMILAASVAFAPIPADAQSAEDPEGTTAESSDTSSNEGGALVAASIAEEESATGMSIVDGMAQPVFAYSDVHAAGYTNAGSELYRFIVYVETDYDTDLDGKCDLVRVYLQVPRAAVEGKYQAPVLFRADPYSAGMRASFDDFKFAGSSVDDAALMGRPAHRAADGGKAVSSEDLALDTTLTKAADWNYELYGTTYPSGVTSLDYYLVRGFAVVQAAGLGTYGSEGIECCGTVMERDAFVDVVEWLHGTPGRRAFADAAGTMPVTADWSSGHVGMTGLSYPGAMCYEVATSGVEGLDTVVPVAGPSSWYDHKNRQGICADPITSYNYTTVLADTCASRLFADDEAGIEPDAGLVDLYQRYRTYMRDAQAQLKGDYGPYWAARDWYTGQTGIRASALIVTGLNDTNVTTKHFDLMRDAFLASGCEVKVLLHQAEHVIPANDSDHSDIMIGDHTYLEWLNLWFTRELLDVDNQASALPDFTVQSNADGSFYGSDRWNADDAVVMRPAEDGETTVQAEGAVMATDYTSEPFTGKASANAALWTLSATEQFTIAGRIAVNLRVKVDDMSEGDMPLCAVLLDVADEPFDAFSVTNSVGHEVVSKGEGNSRSYNLVRWTQDKTTTKMISTGRIDLRNPEAGYEPATAVERTDPIQANTYYDYTVWLDPTYYTVQAGHRLELYIVPFLGYTTYSSAEMRDYILEKIGLDSSALMDLRADYSFTILNEASFARLPIAEEASKVDPDPDPSGADEETQPKHGSSVAKSVQSSAPKTSDSIPLGAVVALIAIAVVAALVSFLSAKKERNPRRGFPL